MAGPHAPSSRDLDRILELALKNGWYSLMSRASYPSAGVDVRPSARARDIMLGGRLIERASHHTLGLGFATLMDSDWHGTADIMLGELAELCDPASRSYRKAKLALVRTVGRAMDWEEADEFFKRHVPAQRDKMMSTVWAVEAEADEPDLIHEGRAHDERMKRLEDGWWSANIAEPWKAAVLEALGEGRDAERAAQHGADSLAVRPMPAPAPAAPRAERSAASGAPAGGPGRFTPEEVERIRDGAQACRADNGRIQWSNVVARYPFKKGRRPRDLKRKWHRMSKK